MGLLLLIVATVASAVLALHALGWLGENLPGCGPSSGCSAVTGGPWGTIPLINWPVSFLGVAWFGGLLSMWICTRGQMCGVGVWLIRCSALGSIFFLIVMASLGVFCPWCATAQIANLLFWIIVERRGSTESSTRGGVVWVGGFAVLSLLLGVADFVNANAADEEFQENLKEIVATGGGDSVFTGRYRFGPEDAPIQIVMISDYQCPDCKRIEGSAHALLQERSDVSLSIKHFPMCVDCNPSLPRNLHPNACWAARAAEAAGQIGGEEGFWKMHWWLVEQQGRFTDQSFPPALQSMGFDPGEFISVMRSSAINDLIVTDVAEALGLGIHYTPMVFINGVELKWYAVPRSLKRAVEEVSAALEQDSPPISRHPPLAKRKLVEDWVDSPTRIIRQESTSWPKGSSTPTMDFVAWIDYQSSHSKNLDAQLKVFLAQHPDSRVTFRGFPQNPACNPVPGTKDRSPQACDAHRASKAAGIIAGTSGFWAMNDWLMVNQGQVTRQAILTAAPGLGLDAAALSSTMDSVEVTTLINEDCRALQRLVPRGIPTLYINNKAIPRWKLGDDPDFDVLEAIYAELTSSAGGTP